MSGDPIVRCGDGDGALRPGPVRLVVAKMSVLEGVPVSACQFIDGLGRIVDEGFVSRLAELEESTVLSCW